MARHTTHWTGLLRWSLAFMLIWYVLTQGAQAALPYGVPIAIAAAVVRWRLAPSSGRVGWRHLASVLPRFLQLVFLGGADVAMRALQPRLPINPGLTEERLPQPGSRFGIATAYILTLQPGTLVVRFQKNGLLLHVIDRGRPVLWLVQDTHHRLKRALAQESDAYDRI